MDFDSLPDDSSAVPAALSPQPSVVEQAAPAKAPHVSQPPTQAEALPSFDEMQDDSDKYGTPLQQAKAFGEGALRGATGPLGTLLEKKAGVNPQDILGREKENPITSGLGEATGLTGSMLTGVGEGALLGKAGELALEGTRAAGYLNDAAKAGSYGYKVGSAAVQQAAEMAVLSGSDSTSKMILQDPDTSAQSAIANMGISALLGGAGGAFLAGTVSPLWDATIGPQAEKFLTAMKTRMNGGAALQLNPEVMQSMMDLGIDVAPELKAGISQDPKAMEYFGTLRRGENPEVLQAIDDVHQRAQDSIVQSLGMPLEDVAHYSENEAGHSLQDTFNKELDEKYEPQHLAMQKRDAEAAAISIADEEREAFRNRLLERGITNIGTDSPYYKEYQELGQRVLAKDTLGGLDKLRTEINNRIDWRGDKNLAQALTDIRQQIGDFQESQIVKNAKDLTNHGVAEGMKSGEQLLAERQAANQSYSKFAGTMDDLTNHLGIGDFRGTGTLKAKINEKITPEQLLRKFSPKGNADIIPFLQEHFPETLQAIQRNEAQSFLRGAVKTANGESKLDIRNLGKTMDRALSKEPERLNFALSPDVQKKVRAANTLLDAIPNPKNSGTPAGIIKTLGDLPSSALASVGWMTGHGALGALIGAGVGKFGVAAPEAYKLAYLRFMSAEEPINAKGFKTMVDFLHNTYKGENLISKATSAVVKRGSQVLTTSQMPVQADREKLEKQVDALQKNPDTLMQKNIGGQLGHYLPSHQTALVKATTQATQYLQSIKPQPHTFGALDKPVPPQPSEIARYNRALNIAIQPAVVMQHIKDGTLMPSDIQDLHSMYPELYTSMSQKLSNVVTNHHAEEEPIPYHTKIGISLFLGQPMDSSMMPGSIMAAQPIPKPPVSPQQGGTRSKTGATSKLGKNDKSYMTATQSAESDRNDRT